MIHGEKQLSLGTGVFLNDLTVHSGVSREKLPLVLFTCLIMLFGEQAAYAAHSLVKTVSTNDTCMRRASEAVKAETTSIFSTAAVGNVVPPELAHVPLLLSAHLLVDDSNKGVDMSVLPFCASYSDSHVSVFSLCCVVFQVICVIDVQYDLYERHFNVHTMHFCSVLGEARGSVDSHILH